MATLGLKRTCKIEVKAILLLLIYVFSNSPSNLFHEHHLEIASFEEASSCEKSIYYSDLDGHCAHSEHISKSVEKCCLCDNHTAPQQTTTALTTEFFLKEFSETSFPLYENYFAHVPSTFSNRGPPFV